MGISLSATPRGSLLSILQPQANDLLIHIIQILELRYWCRLHEGLTRVWLQNTSLSDNEVYIPKQRGLRVTLSSYTPAFPFPDTLPLSDLFDYISFARYTYILHLILHGQTPATSKHRSKRFRGRWIRLHDDGHHAMGGNPEKGAKNSGNYGVWCWFLHHDSMINRLGRSDKVLDLTSWQYAIAGTKTYVNKPASLKATLEMMSIGYLNGNVSIEMKGLMNTTDIFWFCLPVILGID